VNSGQVVEKQVVRASSLDKKVNYNKICHNGYACL
jgi:hypothetical protein